MPTLNKISSLVVSLYSVHVLVLHPQGRAGYGEYNKHCSRAEGTFYDDDVCVRTEKTPDVRTMLPGKIS